ncbi:MAG: beta-lactamase family protein [Phycisphaeraceae bacterium]|nr:beta-lactamase family protein [Phycisphaeraceae bacterium]
MHAKLIVTMSWLMAVASVWAARVEARPTIEPTVPAGVKIVEPNMPDASVYADVSGLLEEIRAKHGVPALTAMVVRDCAAGPMSTVGVLGRGVAGKRAEGQPPDATMQDKWHVGSCTKAMTAVLCALLVEEGKLRWDSTIGEVFEDRLEEVPEHYRGVTLEQLLRHTSGLPANLPGGKGWMNMLRSEEPPERDRVLAFGVVMKQGPKGKPGERFEYSNVGYMIAGHMAETVMGKPYEDLMRERVFVPLGMFSAGFGPPGEKGKFDQPRGHYRDSPAEVDADNPKCYAPAGTVHVSMLDWARFASVFLSSTHSLRPRALSDESIKRLIRPTPKSEGGGNGYAMGWVVTERSWAGMGMGENGPALTHSGSNTLWFCTAWIAPKADVAVLVACNTAGDAATAAVDEACRRLIELTPALTRLTGYESRDHQPKGK